MQNLFWWIIFLVVSVSSLSFGGLSLGFSDWIDILIAPDSSTPLFEMKKTVLLNIRLPRLVMAILVGILLAISGFLSQRLFKNPLAEPSLLGISTGASLFAALFILLSGTVLLSSQISKTTGMIIAAFSGALLVSFIVFRLGRKNGQTSTPILLLSGVALNLWSAAFLGLILFMSNDEELRDITFWTMGSIANVGWDNVVITGITLALSLIVIYTKKDALDTYILGEEEAFSMGVSVKKLKNLMIFLIAIITAILVSQTGVIGFIALIAPHVARLLKGDLMSNNFSFLMLLGALFLVLSDFLARTLLLPTELPIGVITGILGAPYFLWILIKNKKLIL
ncbi:MAG: iron ABC transporter permease [Flavobacteriales bacterium]|jgi:iron complex transport system permease protein|nr:iron ABC transporter permease [Flavobacteriales bacterium]